MFFQSIITSLSFPKNTTLPNIPHFVNALFINSLPSTSDTQGFSATTQSLPPFPRKPFTTPSWICYQYISLPLLKRFRLTNYLFFSEYNTMQPLFLSNRQMNCQDDTFVLMNCRVCFSFGHPLFSKLIIHMHPTNHKLNSRPYHIYKEPLGYGGSGGDGEGVFLENSLEFSFSCKYLAHTGVHRIICLFIR